MLNSSKGAVKYNVRNAHYAMMQEGENGAITYGTPKKIPGTVSITLNARGEMENFYADGVAYAVSTSNNGYDGECEFAMITDEMYKDLYGCTVGTTSKVITENVDDEPNPFALLFAIDGNKGPVYFTFYYCIAGRPTISAKTIEEGKRTPETDKMPIQCIPLANGKVRAKSSIDSPKATTDAWFTSVIME